MMLYASTVRIARMDRPSGYSGMGVVETGMSGTAINDQSLIWEIDHDMVTVEPEATRSLPPPAENMPIPPREPEFHRCICPDPVGEIVVAVPPTLEIARVSTTKSPAVVATRSKAVGPSKPTSSLETGIPVLATLKYETDPPTMYA